MNKQHLERLLRWAGWLVPTSVLLVCTLVAMLLYVLIMIPLIEARFDNEQRLAVSRVAAETKALVGQVERVLLTTRDWGQAGLFDFENPDILNRVLKPIIQQRAQLSSVHYARDDGREVMLLKTPTGWKNRITDAAGKGKLQHWIEWTAEGAKTGDEMREQDYDPRTRPWFTEAMATPPGEIHWTAPYVFRTTGDPGITLTVRWLDASGRSSVVAYDILLLDLSHFTVGLAYGKRGYVALLTEDDKLLGLPRHPGFDGDAALKAAVLKSPGEAGLSLLDTVLRQPEFRQRNHSGVVTHAGEEWLVSLVPLAIRHQKFAVAALVPAAEFSFLDAHIIGILAGVLLLLLATAYWAARQFTRRIGTPITQLFDELSSSRERLEQEVEVKDFLAELAVQVQQSASTVELGQRTLSLLSQRLEMRQGMLAATSGRETLAVVARYGALPETQLQQSYAFGEGLVGQCARDRQPACIALPGDESWRIRSGLGSAPPAEVWAFPVCHGSVLAGVLELGVMKPLDAAARQLMEQVLPVLALPLYDLEGNR